PASETATTTISVRTRRRRSQVNRNPALRLTRLQRRSVLPGDRLAAGPVTDESRLEILHDLLQDVSFAAAAGSDLGQGGDPGGNGAVSGHCEDDVTVIDWHRQ